MVSQCSNCGTALRCMRCEAVGAFEKDAGNIPIHTGNCVYEPCDYCNKLQIEEEKRLMEVQGEKYSQYVLDLVIWAMPRNMGLLWV